MLNPCPNVLDIFTNLFSAGNRSNAGKLTFKTFAPTPIAPNSFLPWSSKGNENLKK